MKIIFEFDTEAPMFNKQELQKYYRVNDITHALYDIIGRVRRWDKFDTRRKIPKKEIVSSVTEVLKAYDIKLDKIGY